ncbi:glycosyltransferase family 4 protein [Haloferax sp. S1W]|uniref:glycosyltransferase family 4 protein n=1 Tax=Haloferax sp. S1W TaxID=3377110 RepID=UPI0037C62917
MRIGINARTFSVDEPGGAVQASIRLAKELIDHPDNEVVLFGSSSLSDEFDTEVCSTGFVDSQAVGLVWERTILPLLARKADIDVLYCPNGNGPLHELDLPVVMCIHDVNAQKGMSNSVHQVYRKLTVPVAARACDTVVTVSKFSKNEICSEINVPQSKVEVIYNGIDEIYFGDERTAIDVPDKYLLFVGSLNPRKNISGILEAYRCVQQDQNIDLAIIGPSNKDIFKSLDIGPIEGVRRFGFLDSLEVKHAYENAEALVFPSFYEGFGLPPLEAFACGTPVVASDCSALPELLGERAIYVNPESPRSIAMGIKKILNGEFNYSEADLQQQATQYTWKSVAQRVLRVIDDL